MDLANQPSTENTQSHPHLEEYERRINLGITNLTSYIYREPAIVLTILYLIISTIGILYLAMVLFGLDVNVLPHVDLIDFVLSAIHYPMTLAIFLAFFIFLTVVFLVEAKLRKQWRWYRNQLEKYHKRYNHKHPILYFVLVVVIYLFISADLQSRSTIHALKAGEKPQFSVQLNAYLTLNKKSLSTLNNVQVIANLSKHLWLYQHRSEQVFMIAHENIKLITPLKVQPKIIHDSSKNVGPKTSMQNKTNEGEKHD